jgi:hypothetical protein
LALALEVAGHNVPAWADELLPPQEPSSVGVVDYPGAGTGCT